MIWDDLGMKKPPEQVAAIGHQLAHTTWGEL
jgi:hypothetical protein